MRIVLLLVSMCGFAGAQQHEIGLTLGGLAKQDRAGLSLGSGVALQANYGYRLVDAKVAALYGEVHLLANPQRVVNSADPSVTRDIATLYVTPGVRLKFLPHSRLSPFIAAGAGYAQYEQSTFVLSGAANRAPRNVFHGAFDYGGGVDWRGWWPWLGFRAEVRDFYTGSPAFNSRLIEGGQHNVVAGGGLVLRFGRQ